MTMRENTQQNMAVTMIALERLRAHPLNSNVMPKQRLVKLRRHIRATGHYPPLIVRPMGMEDDVATHQVLDGHHRWGVLASLGYSEAMCVVWEVDDEQALVLLATLNRLEGSDDPKRRAMIIGQLARLGGMDTKGMARLLPESAKQIGRLGGLNGSPPRPVAPPTEGAMGSSLTFYLTSDERARVLDVLQQVHRDRTCALMRVIGQWEQSETEMNTEMDNQKEERKTC